MKTFLTNDNNEIYIDNRGNFATSPTRLTAIQQLVNNKLQTFLGEIELNTLEGVDYFGIILQEQVPVFSKINELVKKILEVDGVLEIQNVNYGLENEIASFDISIKTDVGSFTASF